MEFCITCGGIIPDDAIFCPNCGSPGTKYRLEHGDTPPEAPEAAAAPEPEAVPLEAAGESDYSFGVEADRMANEEQPSAEAEADRSLTVAQRRNKRILNEENRAEEPSRSAEYTEDTNKSAITGFVFSLLPIPFFLSPIIGLIISASAHRRAKSGAYRNDLVTLAIAGKVISIVRIVLSVLLIGLAVAAVLTLSYMHQQGLELNLNDLWK